VPGLVIFAVSLAVLVMGRRSLDTRLTLTFAPLPPFLPAHGHRLLGSEPGGVDFRAKIDGRACYLLTFRDGGRGRRKLSQNNCSRGTPTGR
jgi:hypothetical protein